MVAAIGMGAGAGYYWAAVIGTLLTIFALWPLGLLKSETLGRMRPEDRRLAIELHEGGGAGGVLDLLADRARQLEVRDYAGRRTITAELDGVDETLLAALSDIDSVAAVRWRK